MRERPPAAGNVLLPTTFLRLKVFFRLRQEGWENKPANLRKFHQFHFPKWVYESCQGCQKPTLCQRIAGRSREKHFGRSSKREENNSQVITEEQTGQRRKGNKKEWEREKSFHPLLVGGQPTPNCYCCLFFHFMAGRPSERGRGGGFLAG